MSRWAWWLGGSAATLLVLPVVAVGVAIAVVDPDDYKPQLAAAVQDATGRALTLNGPLRISRSLWPTVEVTDVKLANLPGGTRPDMARAERIEAQLSLPALIRRRIEVTRLTLIGPNILFEQVGGKPNWVFDADPAPPAPSPPDPAPPAPSGPPRPAASPAPGEKPAAAGPFGSSTTLRIRIAHVQNGMVTFKLPARTKVVGIRSLDFDHLIDGGPLDVASVLVYADNQPFSLNASAQPTGHVTDPWTTRLDFAAFDATASATGTMSLAGGYDLQLAGKAAALEKLNALLPEMQLPALHAMTLSTHVTNGPVRGDLPVIGKTQLHVGGVDLGDRVAGLKLGPTDVSLPAAGAAAALSGSGTLSGQAFTLGGTFGVPEHLDGRAGVPIDLTARIDQPNPKTSLAPTSLAPTSLALKGKLTLDTGRFEGLDAAMALRAPALAALRPMVSPGLPALTAVSLDGRLAVPADAGSLSLRDAKLSAHEGDLSGDAAIGLGGSVSLNGRLRSTRLDVDALLTAFGVGAPAAAASTDGPMIPATPLPWAMLRGPAVDLDADLGAVSYGQQTWTGVSLALQLKAGRLDVSRLRMALPNGPLAASLTADARTDAVPVSLVLHAPGIPLALVARLAGLPGSASGAIRVDTELRAVGRSPHALAASLDGSFAATMVGGSLSNAALIELTAASLQALNITVPAQGDTAIRCFGLIGAFNKGVGRFKTIALDTTYLEMDGAGQFDLGAETVALKLHPLARLSGSSVSVPVLVEGPFRGVQGRLDASGLDKLGLLIDAWFGGDQPETCSNAGLVPARPGGR